MLRRNRSQWRPSPVLVPGPVLGLCSCFCRHAAVWMCHHQVTDVSWGCVCVPHCPTLLILLKNVKDEKTNDRQGKERERRRASLVVEVKERRRVGRCTCVRVWKNGLSVWAGGELSSRKRPSWHLNSDLCCGPGAESSWWACSQTASFNTAEATYTHPDTHTRTGTHMCTHPLSVCAHVLLFL